MTEEQDTFVRGWPGRVAVGIVRSDPPQVYLADSDAVLSRLLALAVVARSNPAEFRAPGALHKVREALLQERWADAVVLWIEATGEEVDGYPDETVWTHAKLDREYASMEIRVSPIFSDSGERTG